MSSNPEGTGNEPINNNNNKCVTFIQNFFKEIKRDFTCEKGIRLGFVVIGIVFMIINSQVGLAMPSTAIECVEDKTFSLMEPLNSFFESHRTFKIVLMVLSSLSIDVIIVFCLFYWGLYGKSSRYIISMVIFFVFYLIIKQLFQIRMPERYIWEEIAFPSLFVSYSETSSLFFSSSVGLLIITCFEFKENKQTFFFFFTIFVLVFESFLIIILRGHYIIDIFAGIFLGHYIYIIVRHFSSTFDKFFKMDNRRKKEIEIKNEVLIPIE